jgi:NDP-sugar pyrophosphorylase family protein
VVRLRCNAETLKEASGFQPEVGLREGRDSRTSPSRSITRRKFLRAFFGDEKKWGVRIDYSLETKPMSTVAPLSLISDLPENFLLMNGDLLTDFDLSSFLERHVAGGRLFTIAAARRLQLIDFGVLNIDSSHRLTGFSEKPQMEYLVSIAVYAVNRRILQFVPPDSRYGFDDLMKDLLSKDEPVTVQPYEGYWLDIGRPDDYERAIEEFEQRRHQFLPAE